MKPESTQLDPGSSEPGAEPSESTTTPGPEATGSASAGEISAGMVALLAVACGVVVMNLYYAQPLLKTIADQFHTTSATAGLIITFVQIGYALGLAFLVPLGDVVAPRRLVGVVLLGAAVILAACSAAPNIDTLIVLALPLGALSVVAQILVPLAASLAGEAKRGQVVGTVMGGLLIGILLARTLSGLVAGVTSWRVVYVAAAAMMVALAGVLSRWLPQPASRVKQGYGSLLASTLSLFMTEPLLRRRAAFGGLAFAAFSVFWTTVAFLLSGPHYHYSDTVIGLFGLVGAAGALCANLAGRFADRGWSSPSTAAFSLLILVSFAPLYLGRSSLGWLIVGIVLLDIGTQGMQITNQGVIYSIAPESRSRINSSYMVTYFVGGALGSSIGSAVESSGGWGGVCVLGAAIGLAGFVLWLLGFVYPPTKVSRSSA